MINELESICQDILNDSNTEEELKAFKKALKEVGSLVDLYHYQKVNPKLNELMYPKADLYLAQLQEAFPKMDWEVTKGDIHLMIYTKYVTSDQLTIEFKCASLPSEETWWLDAPFISDLEWEHRDSFSTLEEAMVYLKEMLIKVKQSVEKLI